MMVLKKLSPFQHAIWGIAFKFQGVTRFVGGPGTLTKIPPILAQLRYCVCIELAVRDGFIVGLILNEGP